MHVGCRFWVAIVLSVSCLSVGQAQDPADLGAESTWQGLLDLGAAQLRVQFQFQRNDDGTYRGKLISPDQGNVTLDLDSVSLDGRKLTLACKKLRVEYSGEVNADNTKITGTFTQGTTFPLDLEMITTPKNLQHVETWTGKLQAGPKEFDFQVRILKDDEGKRHAQLDSFSEGLGDLGLVWQEQEDGQVQFDLPISKAKFSGKYDADRTRLVGKWLQNGNELDLEFEKVDLLKTRSVKPPARPQNPSKPYPYREEDVRFENKADQVTLAGTLTLPPKTGKYPAAILISGSGGQDRDESLLEHKPFLVLSDHLTRAGFAVLRFDDRGIGESTGDHAAADSRDFARDVEAGVDFLKNHSEIEASKIGLIGHSEGGLIAPMVAAERDDVAFIVLLAGPGVNGREIVLNQVGLIAAAEAGSAAEIQVNREVLTATFDLLTTEKTDDEIKTALRARYDEFRQKLPAEKRTELSDTVLESSLTPMLTPWFRFFLVYEPQPTLARVRCPVLALNGALDLQVDPKLNLPPIEAGLKAGGNPDFTVRELPQLNHLFQSAKTGSPTEYRTIEETMSPTALQAISEWLAKRFL